MCAPAEMGNPGSFASLDETDATDATGLATGPTATHYP